MTMSEACDYYGDDEPHDEFCSHATFTDTRTKGDWVELAEGIAMAVLESFRILREEEGEGDGWTDGEWQAVLAAVTENGESMACHVGLGSCGRGWCEHS